MTAERGARHGEVPRLGLKGAEKAISTAVIRDEDED